MSKRRPRKDRRRMDIADEPKSGPNTSAPVSWIEVALVVVILSLGVVSRLANPANMAVEHFDEGVYASNYCFDPSSAQRYPLRHLYSPPFVPALIETSILFDLIIGNQSKTSVWGVMLPNLLGGCATIVAIWWFARRAFGRGAAVCAMTLCALSEIHTTYSRTALTDVWLLFWITVALYFIADAFASGSLRAMVIGGLATGLSWWTKYNGWLPLLIAPAGICAIYLFVSCSRPLAKRHLTTWIGAVAIAGIVWAPYLVSLNELGGYGQVMANHRKYVTGISGWPTSLTVQAQNLRFLEGWQTCIAFGIAILFAQFISHSADAKSESKYHFWPALVLSTVLVATAAWLGSPVVLLILGLFGVFTFVRRERTSPFANYFGWMAAAWFALLLVMTPLYTPYPRLTLPWLGASWLCASAGIVALWNQLCRQPRDKTDARWRVVAFAASAIALAVAIPMLTAKGRSASESRTGVRTVAEAIAARVNSEPSAVYVFGEPALFYHLHQNGVATGPIGTLEGVDLLARDTKAILYVAAGLHAERTPEFEQQLAALGDRIELVAEYPYYPSTIVLLNQHRPARLRDADSDLRQERFRLFRVRGPPPPN